MNDPANEYTVRPWYREPWPWIIIGLLGTVIIASLVTLWIAVSNPDGLGVDESEYQEIRRGLRARQPLCSAGSDGLRWGLCRPPDQPALLRGLRSSLRRHRRVQRGGL